MFNEFNFELLNDPDFKEDSVREELILPILKKLGYSASGDSKIIRGKSLIHPYVAIGSKQRQVSIIPDYVFLSDNKPYWILDAKSPVEDIFKSKHVEQAYSYAIHPEIRAELYALCNGREFALYSIHKFEPLLHFELEKIDENWEFLYRILNSKIKANPKVVDYQLDYGMYIKRLGASEDFKFIGVAINSNFIAKIEDDLYSTTTVIPGDIEYVMSLDFSREQLNDLLSILPDDLANLLSIGLKRQPYVVQLENREFQFGVVAKLTNEIIHNAEESYIPFEVEEFMEYVEL